MEREGVSTCCTPKFALPFSQKKNHNPRVFSDTQDWLRNQSDRFSPMAVNQELGFFSRISQKKLNSQKFN